MVLNDTTWLSEEEKKLIAPGSPDFGSQKPIWLLLETACIIDDSISSYSMGQILPSSKDRYLSVKPQTFNPVKGVDFAEGDSLGNYFSLAMVDEIVDKFPPVG